MIHFCVEGILFFNITGGDNYLQSSQMAELCNRTWNINAATIACIYSFCQQYE